MFKDIFSGISTLTGLTIGAGMLGLPYVVSKVGFILGMILMVILGIVCIVVNLCIAEVVLRTKGKHQLAGLAEKYYGKKGKFVFSLFSVLSLYGSLAAYVIGSGVLLVDLFGGNSFFFSLIFWFVLSCALFGGLKVLQKFENIFASLKMFLLLLIAVIATLKFNRLDLTIHLKNVLYPYGVILFAFSGIWAIPEMAFQIKDKKDLKRAIIYGGIIIILFCMFFVFGVISSLDKVEEVGTIGLGLFGDLFALFAFATAFVAIGFSLKDSYHLDYKINEHLSAVLVIIVPFILLLFGALSFIKLLDITGGLIGGSLFIMSILLFLKAKKKGNRKPEFEIKLGYLSYILILLLIIGLLASVYYAF